MTRTRKHLLSLALVGAVFTAGALWRTHAQQTSTRNVFGTPASIIHVVIIKWNEDSTPEQRQKALEGVREMAAAIPGIKNVWTKATRVQPREFHDAFVIEFENRAAADAYADHPAHRAWEEIYLPIRDQSRSQQITN